MTPRHIALRFLNLLESCSETELAWLSDEEVFYLVNKYPKTIVRLPDSTRYAIHEKARAYESALFETLRKRYEAPTESFERHG